MLDKYDKSRSGTPTILSTKLNQPHNDSSSGHRYKVFLRPWFFMDVLGEMSHKLCKDGFAVLHGLQEPGLHAFLQTCEF